MREVVAHEGSIMYNSVPFHEGVNRKLLRITRLKMHPLKTLTKAFYCFTVSIISTSALPSRPIPVKELPEHCARYHANNNALFNDEFKVWNPYFL